MEETTYYNIIIIVVLLAFWWYVPERLVADPSLTAYIISISYGMLTVITIVIQLVLRENIQSKMRQMLNSEIEERREELVEELNELSIYLAETKIPTYVDSGVEKLEDDFKELDSIKSRYTFQPKIIRSTLFIVLSSLVLVLFWANPTWVAKTEGYPDMTLAHMGLGLLAIALWWILSILVTSLELKIWEIEETEPKTDISVDKTSLES